jgi:Tfp pilus assembly protein PilX
MMNARLLRARDEQGIAVVIAITTITVTLLLAAALVSAATFFLHSSSRDSSNKRAFAAAQAGLNAGVYRLSRIGASPSASFSNNCITDKEVAWSNTAPHCPAATGYFNVTGASSTYYLTPDMSASLTGMPTVATECASGAAGDRCITAIGTVNGITRRLQERVRAIDLFSIHGLLGLKKVEINSSEGWGGPNFQVTSDTGSNGAITYGENVNAPGAPYGCFLGPLPASAPPSCTTTRYTTAITVPSVDTLPFASTQTTNSNATIAIGYTAATRSLTVAPAATLTLAAGDYNFCFVTLGAGATLQAAEGARVRIFVDSPSRAGSGCTSPTGGKFNAGVIGGASAKINPSTTAGQLEAYLYGTVTPPANLASPPPPTCNNDFVFTNGSSATSNALYVYAPDSKVSIQSNAYQYGAVVACEMVYWALSNKARWDYPPTGIRPSSGAGMVTGSFRECTPQYTGDPESGCG